VIAGSATTVEARPGALDFYRALGGAIEGRWTRAAPYVEGAAIASWFLLRSAGAPAGAMGLWTAATAVLAVLAPTSGLVVLAAIGPFTEGFLITRDVGTKPLLALALAGTAAIRVVPLWRGWRRVPVPVLLGLAVLVGTGAGLAVSRLSFGRAFYNSAVQIWLAGIATMIFVFVASAWVARHGTLRPLIVATAGAALAGIASLVAYLAPTALPSIGLAWVADAPLVGGRLTGVMRSPTSTAALIMLPAMLALAAVVAARDRRLRIGAAVLLVPLVAAAYLTYNRAVFLALFVFAVIVAWRIRPRYGVALAVVGIVAGLALLPGYIALRMEGVGMTPEPGQVLLANDRQRLEAWAASIRMFVAEPLRGFGYRSYREVAPQFGGLQLNAPHSEWLRLFAENGAVVGLAGIAFVAATALSLARIPGWLGLGILGAFLSLAIAACFNNPFLFNQVTIPAFVITGTGIALAGRARAPASELATAPVAVPLPDPASPSTS
jgi:hypothetical protein